MGTEGIENKKTYKTLLIDYLPFIILFVLMVIIHFFIVSPICDDRHFAVLLDEKQMNIFQVLAERYYEWSSRLIIEFSLISVVNYTTVWKIINIIMCTTLPFFVSRILKCDRKGNWFLLFLSLVFPFYLFCDVGWVATTTNYLWPLWCAVFIIYILSIYKRGNGHIIFVWYIVSIPLILYGCNAEQCSGLICVILVLFIVQVIIEKRKKLVIYPAILLVLNIVSMIFIMSAPGNSVRLEEESRLYFPGYSQFGFFDKIFLGMGNNFRVMFSEGELMIICLLIVLIAFVYKTRRHNYEVVVAIVPAFLSIGYLVSAKLNSKAYFASVTGDGHNTLYDYLFPTVPIVVNKYEMDWVFWQIIIYYVLTMVCIVMSLYFIYRDEKKRFIFMGLFVLAGFGLSVIICFASTMYTSGFRAGIYGIFGLGFVIAATYMDIRKRQDSKGALFSPVFVTFAVIVSIVNYLFNLYGVIGIQNIGV